MSQEIMVSIVCNAYNHERYIRQTLESFVMQKTDFPFEILVHDDASTDSTAQIIREFEEKYPELFVPIYQTVNQYSQKISILRTFQYPRARGKYIALCEGDDYWIDPLKLQKQVDAMERHPEVDVSTHSAQVVRDEEVVYIKHGDLTEEKIFTPEEVIRGGGSFVTTNSLMFRTDFLNSQNDFTTLLSLDYIIQISTSLRGGMLFLPECMSAYRSMAVGSWTVRMQKDPKKKIEHIERCTKVLRQIDEKTNFVHTKELSRIAGRSDIRVYAMQGKVKKVLSKECKAARKSFPLKGRTGLVLMALCRWVRPYK